MRSQQGAEKGRLAATLMSSTQSVRQSLGEVSVFSPHARPLERSNQPPFPVLQEDVYPDP